MKNVKQCIKWYDHLKEFWDSKLRPHLSIMLCTFPIFTNFPTAFVHLIKYSHHTQLNH